MNIFKRIKIRTKLTILIAFMIISLISIGILGTYYYKMSIKALNDVHDQNITAIVTLTDTRTQTRANFANILNLIVTEDVQGRDKILKDYKKRSNTINKNLNDLKKTKLDSYEKEQYKLIEDKLNKWNDISSQMVEMVSTEKRVEASLVFKNSGEAAFEDLQNVVRDLSAYNIKEVDTITKHNNEEGKKTTKKLIITITLLSVICIALGIIIIRTITVPISRVIHLINRTSNLDLIYDKSYDTLFLHKDEVGIIAKAVEELRSALRNMVGNISNISNNLAASSEELAASTEENTKSIDLIVNAINEIAQGNNVQAEMVSNTSDTIVSMVSNIEEINKSTVMNSDNAEKSIDMIDEGQKAIDLTVQKMTENKQKAAAVGDSIIELSRQMDKVSNIISVIKDISSQTNLLALNASIEAARAGESGKGFAVVAAEIGNLAQDTAAAVNEITGIITDAVLKNTATSENMEKVQKIVIEQEEAIEITKAAFDKIKESVDDIANSTIIISDRMKEINASANNIADKTQDMSAVAEESAASSEEISASNEEQLASIQLIAASANELSTMATDLNNEIGRFKL